MQLQLHLHLQLQFELQFQLQLHLQLKNTITTANVIAIAIHVFLSGISFKKIAPKIADNIGAIAIITKVLATFVFLIETTKVILVTEKVII